MARSLIPFDTRRRLDERDSKWRTKAILRISCTFFALWAMIMFAVSVSYTNQNFINTAGNGDWTDGLALAPAILSLLLNPILLLTYIHFRRGHPFHPAWYLTLDLITWGLCIPSIVFSVAGGLFWYWTPVILSSSGEIDCGFFFNEWSRECNPVAYTIGHMEIAGIVFLFCVFILHFTLFIFSCIAVHHGRRAPRMSKMSSDDMDMPYHRDPEDHGSNGPPAYSPQGSLESARKEEATVVENAV